MVEAVDGAKAGDRVRYIQFTDSMYFAPAQPFARSRSYLCRYRGADAGTSIRKANYRSKGKRPREKYSKNYWKQNSSTQQEQE